jgi:oxygen-independent coproporphyrinogen III oxidase
MNKDLLKKYDLPIPRYTSYPTVPYWENNLDTEHWLKDMQKTLQKPDSSWSMYLHIPFCESLCTFCGCNTIITKNHHLENPYLESILHEFELYLKAVPELSKRKLKHIHLGGGTPTFLSPESLHELMSRLFEHVDKTDEHFEASIEVDPRRTTAEQLKTLRDVGFNRVSMGVQDFDPEVQRLINRIQPFDVTEKLVLEARRLGYRSVNFDLIYGLAKQTKESMRTCAELTLKLRPDRIALYSFALVPWIKPAQRLFKDEDLPPGAEKRELYEIARDIFLKAGYLEIGMDHFALPDEDLSLALKNKSLHRNFMGYTDQKTDLLLALGVSGISQTQTSFHQNEKLLVKYDNLLKENKIPTFKGHALNEEDIGAQKQILSLITQLEVQLKGPEQISEAKAFLKEMLEDQLLSLQGNTLKLTEAGKPFLRNACTFFDERLKRQKPDFQIFSRSI